MKAIPFTSQAHCGTQVNTEEILQKKNLLIYFFPPIQFDKIEQVGQEAYLFKNFFVRLDLKKNEMLGVTDDPTDLSKTFVQRFGIPFHIVYDRDHQVAKNYNALAASGSQIERTLICIRKGGSIRHTFKNGAIEKNLKRMVTFTRLPWYRKLFRRLF